MSRETKTGKAATMGMAASQARFLGLTARLNNVEFEGQQINQQRTALSNKSASYYTDLLGMAVPVAPSVEAFTQTVYTFDDGALTNQITSMLAEGDGTYKVSYLKQWTDDFAIVSATPSIVTRTGQGTATDPFAYKVGSEQLRELEDWSGVTFRSSITGTDFTLVNGVYKDASGNDYDATVDGSLSITIAQGGAFDTEYFRSLSVDQFAGLSKEEAAYAQLLPEENSNNHNYFVRYVANTTTGEYKALFYDKDILEDRNHTMYDDVTGNSLSFIQAFERGSKKRSEEIKAIEGCRIEQDSTGRFISIWIPDTNASTSGRKYALTTNTITDQDAYEDAMNQYEYDKALYDQSIAEINAKIEIVQAEDKDLELRLKQLDTEHNALQQEKETVASVIKKNVEGSFKTFG